MLRLEWLAVGLPGDEGPVVLERLERDVGREALLCVREHEVGARLGPDELRDGDRSVRSAARPDRAVDELEKVRIQTLTHPLYPDNRGALPCAVTMFNAGSFPSATPEEAVLRGSMGLMPYEDLDRARAQLVEQIRKVATEDPWMRQHPPEVAFDGMAAAGAEIPVDHPIVQTVQEAFRQVLGRPPVLSGRKGAADTRFLIRYGSTPTVIFGPGSTAQMHAMNESVPVNNVIAATKVLALAILHWCT